VEGSDLEKNAKKGAIEEQREEEPRGGEKEIGRR
jgi:hypothetical protein